MLQVVDIYLQILPYLLYQVLQPMLDFAWKNKKYSQKWIDTNGFIPKVWNKDTKIRKGINGRMIYLCCSISLIDNNEALINQMPTCFGAQSQTNETLLTLSRHTD